jgi:nitrogenase delta subunit
MTPEQVQQLYDYVQERCLWQFFSRTWDRQENIDGIMAAAEALLTNRPPKRETPMERLHYADAVIMVADFKQRFPWVGALNAAQTEALLRGVKGRVTDISITSSLNHELNHTLY